MMNDRQFLAEILEHPENDEPRLVYADWLEERGDHRGEFIRLQIALSKLPVGSMEAAPLRAREAELLHEYGRDWAGLVGTIAANHPFGRGYHFCRGFVEAVDLSLSQFLAHSKQLFAEAPIRAVSFARCTSPQGRQLIGNEFLSRLKIIQLSECRFGGIALKRLFDRLSGGNLEVLSIVQTDFGPNVLRALASSGCGASLRGLFLRPKYRTLEVEPILRAAPVLEFLDLYDARATTNDAHLIASTDLDRLRYLRLDGMEIGAAGIDALLRSSKPRLRWLSIAHTQQPERFAGSIAPQLERLALAGSRLNNEQLDALAQSKSLVGLKNLDLHNSAQLRPEDLGEFLKSKLFAGLDSLRLSFVRNLSKRAAEPIIRAWKEFDRPEGNLCLPNMYMSGRDMADLRKRYGQRCFVDAYRVCNDGLWLDLLLPGEHSLDVVDGLRDAD